MRFFRPLLLVILCIVMISPLIQQRWHPVGEPELNGIFAKARPPELKSFSWKSWFKGAFQGKFTTAVNENLGFRPTLIRINNQYDWSFFKISHAEGFIAGKEGFLFEEDYIYEYTGKYFIGKATLDLKARRLRAVQDALRARGVCLLLMIEPGKASFYPEYIPDRYHADQRSLSNLEYLKQRMDALQIKYIDLNSWFLAIKDTSRFKLFPEYGMHWSIYGVAVAMDTLSAYLRHECGLALPSFTVERIEISDSLRWTDKDIGNMLNLLLPLPAVTAAYPVIRFTPAGEKRKVDLLAVGDSYFSNIYNQYAPYLFRSTDFWYYNSRYYSYDGRNGQSVDHSNLAEKLESYELILLTLSEINAHCGFWNFVDQAWFTYCSDLPDPEVYGYENRIRNEREWFRSIVKKAAASGISVESAIHRDAVYKMETDRNFR